jgi:cysteine desulfurase / selenocysteine lyase
MLDIDHAAQGGDLADHENRPLGALRMTYLDNSATSFPKPPEVYENMDRFYRTYGLNPGRSGFDASVQAGDLVEETRALLTRLFGGSDPSHLVFGLNATDCLNLALFGLLQPGDHAITSKLDHNATLRPLWHLHEQGVHVDWVDFDEDGYLDPDDVIERFRPNTRAVVLNHGSNVIGTVQPIAPIGQACRERGIPLVVDVSQTAGIEPIQLDDLGADVICFTGHKALMGPMGIGGMYVRRGLTIRHTRAGGTGVRSLERRHLEEYPYRLEYGTPNLLGIAGLNAGVKWLLARGLEAIRAHELRLWRLLRDGLSASDGVTLYCQRAAEWRIGVVACNVRGTPADVVGSVLDVEHDIAVRTGLHCAPRVHERLGTDQIGGTVRFSLGPFNTDQHVQAAVEAVADLVRRPPVEARRQTPREAGTGTGCPVVVRAGGES